MRLLNAWTLRVEEFAEPNTPPYAILSHTWGSQEVLLHDIGTKKAETLKGYPKIIGCCEQAKQDGFAYVVGTPSISFVAKAKMSLLMCLLLVD